MFFLQNAIHVTLYIIRRAFISSSLKKKMYTKISSVHGSCPYCKDRQHWEPALFKKITKKKMTEVKSLGLPHTMSSHSYWLRPCKTMPVRLGV